MNRQKLILIFAIFLVIIPFYSCSHKNETHYKYFEGFKFYLKSTFKMDISVNKDEKIFYVLLLDGCEPCMKYNSEILLELQNDNIIPILIGKPSNDRWNDFIKSLKKKWTVLEDVNNEIFFMKLVFQSHY